MNVIYLNENLQYSEAFPDRFGKLIIPERNVICGFINGGMLYAMKDPKNELLTPFEIFVMFNDMSVEFIQKQHFQEENRVLELKGHEFCELKQVFSCSLQNFDLFGDYIAETLGFAKEDYLQVMVMKRLNDNTDYTITKRLDNEDAFEPLTVNSAAGYVLFYTTERTENLDYRVNANENNKVWPYFALFRGDLNRNYKLSTCLTINDAEDLNCSTKIIQQSDWNQISKDLDIFNMQDFSFDALGPGIAATSYQGDKTGKIPIWVYFGDGSKWNYYQFNVNFEFEGVTYTKIHEMDLQMYAEVGALMTITATIEGVLYTWSDMEVIEGSIMVELWKDETFDFY